MDFGFDKKCQHPPSHPHQGLGGLSGSSDPRCNPGSFLGSGFGHRHPPRKPASWGAIVNAVLIFVAIAALATCDLVFCKDGRPRSTKGQVTSSVVGASIGGESVAAADTGSRRFAEIAGLRVVAKKGRKSSPSRKVRKPRVSSPTKKTKKPSRVSSSVKKVRKSPRVSSPAIKVRRPSRPPAVRHVEKRGSGRALWCDGTLSPTCGCGGGRGCCSHHGGVCGCR